MKPTVLSFNLSGDAQQKLRLACMRLKVFYRPADSRLQHTALRAILSGEAPVPHEASEAPFSDAMVVFANLPQASLNTLLSLWRQMGIPPVPLKAVLTDTNADWTPVQLRDELKKEAEWFATHRTSAHEETAGD